MEPKTIYKHCPPEVVGTFSIGQQVFYRGGKYKIHSFVQSDDGTYKRAFIRKYTQAGHIDSRHRGYIAYLENLTI